MKSAFRNLGIMRSHWRYLIMMAQSPIDEICYYFVDKCLPFGAAISCAIFQAFSNAVAHMIKFKTRMDNVNYLDNFLFIALLKALCNTQVNTFLELCHEIRFPVSLEKTFWSSTRMIFLGFLIDTVAQLVMVPVDKVNKATELLQKILGNPSKKVTLKQL